MSCVTPRSARRDSSPCWESTASMLESFVTWLLDRFRDLGYPGIVVLMAVESSILPLPSELVMPPAGYLVAKGEMDFAAALACGVHGARSPRVVRDPHVDRLVHREPGRRDPRGTGPGSAALHGTGGAHRGADPGAHRGRVRLVVPAARVTGAAGVMGGRRHGRATVSRVRPGPGGGVPLVRVARSRTPGIARVRAQPARRVRGSDRRGYAAGTRGARACARAGSGARAGRACGKKRCST